MLTTAQKTKLKEINTLVKSNQSKKYILEIFGNLEVEDILLFGTEEEEISLIETYDNWNLERLESDKIKITEDLSAINTKISSYPIKEVSK